MSEPIPLRRRIAGTAPARAAAVPRLKAMLIVTELEDYTVAFANGLARHADVVLAVPRRQYARLVPWIDKGVDLRLLDWPRHRSPSNLRTIGALTRIVRAERPDIIHLLSNNTLWLNLALPLWRPVPVVTTVHDVSVHPGDRETKTVPAWSTALAVRQSADVVVHGAGLRQQAIDRFAKRPDRVHVLDHPAITRYADAARRAGLKRRADAGCFTVLMFGRIYAYKGLDQLVAAERILGNRIGNLRIVVAGRGDDPWQLGDRMGDRRRWEVIHRFIEDDEVARLFLDADVVVLPYVEASQSGVLSLAAAFGKPVVATRVGEMGVTVERNGLGLVVPPADPAALARAIERMASDPVLAADAGRRARRWAEGAGSPEAVGAAAAALYADILARRTRPSAIAVAAATSPAPLDVPALPRPATGAGNTPA